MTKTLIIHIYNKLKIHNAIHNTKCLKSNNLFKKQIQTISAY